MAFQTITNRQFASPSAASSPTQVAVGTAWNNPANWTQIAATTDSVWILTGITVWANIAATVTIDFEVDIGTGGVGSEVRIATIPGRLVAPFGIYSQPIRLPIGVDNLNGRHVFRIRTSGTRTDTWNVALTYIKNPVSGTFLITTSPLLVAPSAAAPITMTAGGSWINGSWADIIASASADLVLTGAMVNLTSGTTQAIVDIGVDNVRVTSFPVGSVISPMCPCVYELPNPLDMFPTGSKVSARMRANSAAATAAIKLMYHEKPL